MREIIAFRGQVILVDDEDYPILSKFRWSIGGHGYVVRYDSPGKNVRMHRQILGLSKGDGVHVDHRNGIKTDNTRQNLRICDVGENNRNVGITCRNKSGFKGVYQRANGRWHAQIAVSGRHFSLGIYDTPQEAYQAYCKAALMHHGEFANLG